MINQLRLKNFRKHQDKTFDFSSGLNVLKGANENGKSTLTEALLYLWFGARALREGLRDVVTYGESEKTLRVEGDFTFDGVDYSMYRCTAGAEITYGNHRVTGQTETASFMERLLGAKSDIVRKLMIAEQNSVRGILESEAEAGSLIESLAELSQIDALVEKIQTQWPTGPTKGAEATLRTLQEAVGAVPEKPSDAAVVAASQPVISLTKELESAEVEVLGSASSVQEAKALIEKDRQNRLAQQSLDKQRQTLLAVAMPAPCPWTHNDYDATKEAEKDNAYRSKVEAAKAFKPAESFNGATWDGPLEDLTSTLQVKKVEASKRSEEITALKVKAASKKALKINEGVCSFCKLDISKRPEVETENLKVDKEVQELQEQIEKLQKLLAEDQTAISAMTGIIDTHNKNLQAVNRDFWEILVGTVPAKFRWIGPELVAKQGVSVASTTIKQALRDYEQSMLRYETAQEQLAGLVDIDHISSEELDNASFTLESSAKLDTTRSKLQAELATAKGELVRAKSAYESAVAIYESANASRESALKNAQAAMDNLAEMEYNNQLIKDIRDARSEIRRKLWDATNAAISIYFSRVRKVDTRITYGDKGFMQNGRSVKGLSGSAKDMLGLAIRAALIKTFAPQASLLVVDEPFSGCDADREVAGLSVLCQLDFPQTLLVTHSDLADTLASNLVEV